MCGRFALTIYASGLQELLALEGPAPADLKPRYNIAPSQSVAVVTNSAPRRIEMFKWGLVPSWAKDPTIGDRMINARAETLAEKPSFRTALKKRRCLILADGFYEWRKDGAQKTPMLIQLAGGEPFAFAGLWETWKPPEGDLLKTCTIVTCEPNELLAKIHNRMPVILPRERYDEWLSPGELPADRAAPMLVPFDAQRMKAVAVRKLVNNPANDVPDCLVPA